MRLAFAKKANIHTYEPGPPFEARPKVTTRERRRDLVLFNTMSRRKEPLRVVQGDTLRMFVCGPTVQSFIHVGNARTHVFYDVLARYLTHLGAKVNFLMNITDVDDRITEAARREGVKPSEIADKYTEAFLEDMRP